MTANVQPTDPILLGKGENLQYILPAFSNRHGLVTGATGTGKTVTLQVLAEGFSRIGVPVFLADVKGDLAGLSQAIKPHPKIDERLTRIGITDFTPTAWPVVFWDLFGESGHPVRTTISEMGPLLLSSLLELNDTQEGVLNVAFRVADDEGLLLLDLEDLQALLRFVADNAKQFSRQYGNISSASVAAIQRRLLVLEGQGAEQFFGEPALELSDIRRLDLSGRGVINVLAADRLIQKPRLYATFLLWLLSELFEELPEVGDPEKPGLVFFFDEAHLLFDKAPDALLEKITQVVRLIRSKGVGVFFISQYPNDVPDEVIGQLGNRIQHALRAFTPRDRKAVRAAAQTFRENPAFDTEEAIGQLGVGEALISTLDRKGIPSVVEHTLMAPPRSQFGPIDEQRREQLIARSPLASAYGAAVDRESAYEMLQKREQELAEQREREAAAENEAKARAQAQKQTRGSSGGRGRQSAGEAMVKSIARSLGSSLGRQIMRGILGSLTRRR
jgi:DNA helicase HerA-like ATPase